MTMVHGSLFAGIGGFDCAASWMGWKNAFHCEIDKFCSKILKYHFPDAEHYEDIRTTDFTKWRGQIDVLSGGFPCQPFSLAGRRSARYSPLGSLARTLLESSRWYSPARRLRWQASALCSERITRRRSCVSGMSSRQSARTLSVRDIPSSHLLFRLVPSEHRTDGTGCGLLPTVMTQGLKVSNRNGQTEFIPLDLLPTPMSTEVRHERRVRELKEAGGDTLHSRTNGATRPNGLMDYLDFNGLLPTPNAAEGEKYTTTYNPDSQMGKGLTSMAVNGLLPTPTAIDAGGGRINKSLSPNAKDRPTLALAARMASSRTGHASQLNPRYVSEMMGFPPSWTKLPFLAGERSR